MDGDGSRGTRYQIVIRGRLTDRFASAFSGVTLEPGDGTTTLIGNVADQAQLYGVLERVRDFGLELVRVEVGAR